MHHLMRNVGKLRPSGEVMLSRVVGGFAFSITATISSIYFNSLGFTDAQIGIYAGISSAAVVLIAPLTPIILERFNEVLVYIVSGALLALTYILFGLIAAAPLAVLVYVINRQILSLVISSGSILFRDLITSKETYIKQQGIASGLINLGWVLGPLIAGLAMSSVGISGAFYVAAAIGFVSVALLIVNPVKVAKKTRKKIDTSWRENVRYYFSHRALRQAYAFNFGKEMWWAFMWTFLPLYMIQAGYSLSTVGFVIAGIQVPLMLLEFKTVDFVAPLGYRKIFVSCFTAMALMMVGAFVSGSIGFVIVGYILLSLALSFLEPICEIFFFDQVQSLEEEQTYPVYKTGSFLSALAGRAGAGVAIAVFGTVFGYAYMALVLGYIAFIASQLSPTDGRK